MNLVLSKFHLGAGVALVASAALEYIRTQSLPVDWHGFAAIACGIAGAACLAYAKSIAGEPPPPPAAK
jgi:hypothetical protein